MKRKMTKFIAAILVLTGLSGCTNDSKEPPFTGGENGENTVVEVKLLDASTTTRAAGNNWQAATENEKKMVGDVTILVYNSNHDLEKTHTTTLTAENKSSVFTIKSGLKYFYVVANQTVVETPPGLVSESKRGVYEKQVRDVTFSNPDEELNITTGNFVIGTLWGESQQVSPGGTEGKPVGITLKVGRSAAKVKLYSVSKGTSNMAGIFKEPVYRLGSVPRTYYHVGQYEGTTAPPAAGHGRVFSAVHDEPWEDPQNPDEQNPAFYNHTKWINVTPLPVDPEDAGLEDFCYTVENTTALDKDGYQYYGNTTYVRLRTTYEPTDDELRDIYNLSEKATKNPDGTFYVVTIDREDYIVPNYEKDVSELTVPGLTRVKTYEYGWNYHKFPIRDKTESDALKQNAVLRNHYYEIAVTSIKNLGDPKEDEEVDPSEPIVTDVDIEATISILSWSKVTQNEEL